MKKKSFDKSFLNLLTKAKNNDILRVSNKKGDANGKHNG
jgi:hypothetical protein